MGEVVVKVRLGWVGDGEGDWCGGEGGAGPGSEGGVFVFVLLLLLLSLSGATMGVKSGLLFFRGNASFMQQPSPQQYFSKNFVPLPPSPKSFLIS
jgi:hypothetical protein